MYLCTLSSEFQTSNFKFYISGLSAHTFGFISHFVKQLHNFIPVISLNNNDTVFLGTTDSKSCFYLFEISLSSASLPSKPSMSVTGLPLRPFFSYLQTSASFCSNFSSGISKSCSSCSGKRFLADLLSPCVIYN